MFRTRGLRGGWSWTLGGAAVAVSAAACEVDDRSFEERGSSCPSGGGCLEPAAGAGGAAASLGPAGSSAGAPAAGRAAMQGGETAGAGGGGGGAEPSAQTGETGGAGGTAGALGSAGAGAAVSSCASDQLLSNGDFEAGSEAWLSFSSGQDPLVYDATAQNYDGVTPNGGQRLGWLGGVPNETNRLSQTVNLPANVVRLTFAGALRIQIFEEHALIDFLRISVVASGQRLSLLEFDNGDATEDWFDVAMPVDVSAYAGQPVALELESQIGDGPGTNFYVDDLALVPSCSP